MSPEIVALLVLLGGVVAAVVFTLVIVVAVDPSDTNPRSGNEEERGRTGDREKLTGKASITASREDILSNV